MIYDCFQFFNELDILKLRLHVMSPIVDKFVISEATETFAGEKKPLYYAENKELFKEFEDKIIHVIVEDTPKNGTHERDTFQKHAVGRGLMNCTNEDIIIFSDLDEIPNPEKIKDILPHFEEDKIYHFAQRLFYCYLNMEEISGNLLSYAGDFQGIVRSQWIGSKMCKYKLLKDYNFQLGDLRFPERKEIGIRIADGGWHFGYMGGSGEKDARKRVAAKVRSAAHQEYNDRETLSQVDNKIRDGEDIFGRDASFVQVVIDETFPKYIREHQKEYEHLILKEESKEEIQKRQKRRQNHESYQTMKRKIKNIIKKIIGRR